jgi:hypothetical protein
MIGNLPPTVSLHDRDRTRVKQMFSLASLPLSENWWVFK